MYVCLLLFHATTEWIIMILGNAVDYVPEYHPYKDIKGMMPIYL